jgi:hypothetical protein
MEQQTAPAGQADLTSLAAASKRLAPRKLDRDPASFVEEALPSWPLWSGGGSVGALQEAGIGYFGYYLADQPFTITEQSKGTLRVCEGNVSGTASASGGPITVLSSDWGLTIFNWPWVFLPRLARMPMRVAASERQIVDFLEEVYDKAGLDDIQGATDRIFDYIDRLLCGGSEDSIPVCDEILRRVEVARLPTTLMRSFLTITAAAKDRLPARQAFFTIVEQEMIRQKGAEKAKRLLCNLS